MLFIGRKPLIMVWRTALGIYHVFCLSTACLTESSNTTFARGQSCYEFNVEELTWMQARDYCHERGGRLVSIAGADLETWLSSTAARRWPRMNSIWLGLNRWSTDGIFTWDSYVTSDEPSDHPPGLAYDAVLYSNWAEGYPRSAPIGSNCVLMNRDSGWRWTIKDCWGPYSYHSSFVCEYGNTDAANAVVTSAPDANTDAVASSYPGKPGSMLNVHHAGVLYWASAAAAVICVIIIVTLIYTIFYYMKSRGRCPPKVTAVNQSRFLSATKELHV